MWTELISVGNPFFIGLSLVWALAVMVLVVANRAGQAISLLVGGLVATQLFTDGRPLGWLLDNWYTVVLLALVYFAVGAAWGVVKWYFLVKERAARYSIARQEELPQFLRKSQYQDLSSAAAQEDFRTHMRQRHGELTPPRVNQHRGDIMGWMVFWPISLVWSIVGDGVVYVFRTIATRFSTLYHGIVRKAYGGFSEFND